MCGELAKSNRSKKTLLLHFIIKLLQRWKTFLLAQIKINLQIPCRLFFIVNCFEKYVIETCICIKEDITGMLLMYYLFMSPLLTRENARISRVWTIFTLLPINLNKNLHLTGSNCYKFYDKISWILVLEKLWWQFLKTIRTLALSGPARVPPWIKLHVLDVLVPFSTHLIYAISVLNF